MLDKNEEHDDMQYNAYIEQMRETEYPMLKETTYLDHAGTTLPSKSLIDRFSANMMGNLYGNPHSASQSSQRSTELVDDTRLRLLKFLGADPDDFDVVFVANATAGIKLVADALREHEDGFWYGYHRDAHTSLVGARELAREHVCFENDQEVNAWLEKGSSSTNASIGLFAFPAQSNLNGRRLPLDWCRRTRQKDGQGRILLTLLDAAAHVSTSPLDLSSAADAPDFTVLSLYKIFGFPDLGALIIRKDAGWALQKRRYFGGGTVDMVVSLKEQWHERKSGSLHEQLEDGTLPIHSILALRSAFEVHKELYGTLEKVSRHTAFLAEKLYDSLRSLEHGNDAPVCTIYKASTSDYNDRKTQGPVLAFNLRHSKGAWVSNTEVEKLAFVKSLNLRTGSLCNPGGTAHSLGLAPWEMRQNFSAGQRCGSENDIMGGKPTGIIRASLGAMSTLKDVQVLVDFIKEFFVDSSCERRRSAPSPELVIDATTSQMYIESMSVYPIKSCAGWQIPHDTPWEVKPEGLAWDREWCIVHQSTGMALSQKKYPRMALIRPSLDFKAGVLRIDTVAHVADGKPRYITVPLSADPRVFATDDHRKIQRTIVCGDNIDARAYTSSETAEFLSSIIGVSCQLARFPATLPGCSSLRHAKAHLGANNKRRTPSPLDKLVPTPLTFSNESPILTISRSSLNRLNEHIKSASGKTASPDVFRANIILAESFTGLPEQPYAEDHWTGMRVTSSSNSSSTPPPESERLTGKQEGKRQVLFSFWGGCRRCQMVCVDQMTGEKNQEPFVTLAKTRRVAGRGVLFGVHTCFVSSSLSSSSLSSTSSSGRIEGDGEDTFQGDGDGEEGGDGKRKRRRIDVVARICVGDAVETFC
ncbi:hypothetical protein AAFC00_003610 [Neodothiora populina]